MPISNIFSVVLRKIKTYLPELTLAVTFILLHGQHLNLDFWNDELYTLNHFTFTSLQTTVTDYHVPNNHILFNLINNIYLKLIQVNTLHELMDAPVLLRVLPLVYTGLTLFFVYLIANRHVNRTVACVSVAILITTLPYFLFSLQIRGYGLSALFLVILFYYLLCNQKEISLKSLIGISVSAVALSYTVPSNLYYLLSIIVVLLCYTIAFSIPIIRHKTSRIKRIFRVPYFQSLLAIGMGLLLSAGLYLPIFKDVFLNDYVKRGEAFQIEKLPYYLTGIFIPMVGGRLVLAFAGLLGFVAGFITGKRWHFLLSMAFAICIIPLLVTFMRGDSPPLRIFIVIAPIFSIIFSMGVFLVWQTVFTSSYGRNTILFFGIFAYGIVHFYVQYTNAEDHIANDIISGNRSQDLQHQYYSFNYQPLHDIEQLQHRYRKSPKPVIVQGCEPHGVSHYLEKAGIPFTWFDNIDSTTFDHDSVYFITSKLPHLEKKHEFNVSMLSDKPTYHNVAILHKKVRVSDQK